MALVAFIVVVPMTVQVAVAFGKFGTVFWVLSAVRHLDKHSRRAVPAHQIGRKVL